MHKVVCICDLVPRIETRTRLVVIMHQLEARKTTNTGHLALRCLPNSEKVVRGQHEPLSQAPLWPETHQPVLLFPAPGAQPMHVYAAGDKPVALIVPDGTWSQAARARKRIPCLEGVPAAIVASDGPSLYRLRTANEPGQVCTLEAIALALEVLEGSRGSKVRLQLEHLLRVMVERTLWTRGALAPSEVTGGIPAGARVDRPWELADLDPADGSSETKPD
ncbi:MAG: DTW domain-containing protein [Myxococcales bacterium]|nr:DTW domain-containing protein [Myxococcales bacterium]